MARPKNKEELVLQAAEGFKKLITLVETIPAEYHDTKKVFDKWTIKDILAHLLEWHIMLMVWYTIGKTGEKPEMPGKGFTWKELPKLNELIYQKYKDETLGDIFERLNKTHQKVTNIITAHSNEELFTKKLYPWTGSTSMGSYFTSATSSHYAWALKEIKKWIKKEKIQLLH